MSHLHQKNVRAHAGARIYVMYCGVVISCKQVSMSSVFFASAAHVIDDRVEYNMT